MHRIYNKKEKMKKAKKKWMNFFYMNHFVRKTKFIGYKIVVGEKDKEKKKTQNKKENQKSREKKGKIVQNLQNIQIL